MKNPFNSLRLVRRNAYTAQLRLQHELAHDTRTHTLLVKPKDQNATLDIYRAYVAVKKGSLSKKRTRRKQSIKKAKGGPASLTIEVRTPVTQTTGI